MEYEVYIDESGSINQKRRGIFEIAFLIIAKDNAKKVKKFYDKKIIKFKKDNGIMQNIELKAHYLKENNFLMFADYVFNSFLSNNRVVSAYVDNRNLSSKMNDTDKRFFKIISFIVERCIDRKYFKDGDSIEIFADHRNNISGEIRRLKQNVQIIHNIKISDFHFLDSRNNTLIQIADMISFKCNRIIINSLKNKTPTPKIPNLSFRKIYY